MMFVVLGLFSPGMKRRPPSKKKAKGKDSPTATLNASKGRKPATQSPSAAPAASAARATTATSTAGAPAACSGDAARDVDQELEDILASLMAEIDMADGDTLEASACLSDAGSARSESSGATTASDSSGDSDTSATRAAEAAPGAGEKAARGKRKVKSMLEFNKVAYEAAFGNMPYHVAVTTLFVKYAQLLERLTGHKHCKTPMTVMEAEEVGALAKEFVLGYMVPILGDWMSTKVHKLLAHVIMAIKAHGAISNGDTSGNEALHGKDKRRYSRTSGDGDAFRVQMLRVGQGTLEIQARLDKEAADFDNWFEPGGSDDEGEAGLESAGAAPGGGATHCSGGRPPLARAPGTGGPAIPRRAVTVSVDQLSERRGLGAVAQALSLPVGGAIVHVTNSYAFFPRMACCSGGHPKQHLRATPMYRGLPWYDGVAYRLPGDAESAVRYGVARAIVRAVQGQVREVVVVSDMDICESTPGCPLVGAGCTRLCWSMTPGADWPSLRSVAFPSLLRLEHIVRDFDEVTQAHGVAATPRTIRDDATSRRAPRFYVNVFYPWP